MGEKLYCRRMLPFTMKTLCGIYDRALRCHAEGTVKEVPVTVSFDDIGSILYREPSFWN